MGEDFDGANGKIRRWEGIASQKGKKNAGPQIGSTPHPKISKELHTGGGKTPASTHGVDAPQKGGEGNERRERMGPPATMPHQCAQRWRGLGNSSGEGVGGGTGWDDEK